MTLTSRTAYNLYEAATFSVQEHGAALDARLEIKFERLATCREQDAWAMLTAMGRELAQRYAWWGKGSTASEKLHRVSYLDRTADGELQGWLLFHLPPAMAARVEIWLAKWFARYAEKRDLKRCPPKLCYKPSPDPRNAVAAQWRSFRMIMGGLHPRDYVGAHQLLDLLRVRRADQRLAGLIEGARFHTSVTIGPKARADAEREGLAHVSAWRAGRWDQLYSGWELREYRERQQERQRRASFDAALATRRAVTGDPLAIAHIEQIAAQEDRARSVPAEHRRRTALLWPDLSQPNQRGE